MNARYILIAIDEKPNPEGIRYVLTCEANPLEACLVESMGSASMQVVDTTLDAFPDTIREAVDQVVTHTLDQMGLT